MIRTICVAVCFALVGCVPMEQKDQPKVRVPKGFVGMSHNFIPVKVIKGPVHVKDTIYSAFLCSCEEACRNHEWSEPTVTLLVSELEDAMPEAVMGSQWDRIITKGLPTAEEQIQNTKNTLSAKKYPAVLPERK